MEWKNSWGLRLIVIVFIESLLITEILSARLQFAGWARFCKLPTGDPYEFIKPQDDCDSSTGLVCQQYDTGNLCGCPIGGTLTFDRKSGECRRKVMSACHIPEKDDVLAFNHKCHENAMCSKVNASSFGPDAVDAKRPLPDSVCLCKPGFKTKVDYSECTNGATSSLRFSIAIISIILPVYFYVR